MDVAATILILSSPPAVPVSAPGPTRRYRKELAKVGNYLKPSTGEVYQVTPGMVDQMVTSFGAYTSAGNKVPIPVAHFKPDGTPYVEDSGDANRGWLEAMFREGDSLIGITEITAENPDAIAASNDVSIYAQREYTDPNGNRYDWPVLHVALTPFPVVPGLSPFQAIAASQSQHPAQVPVFIFSKEGNMPDQQVTPAAAPATPAPAASSSRPGDAIREAIKTQVLVVMDDDSIDDATAYKKIKELFKARAKALGVLEALDETIKPADAEQPAAVAASMTADPMVSRLLAENYSMKIDRLSSMGKLNGPQKALLETKAATLTMSRDAIPHLDQALALAELAEPTLVGELTRAQTLVMSDSRKADTDATKKIGDEMLASVRRRAGLKPQA